MKPRYFVRVPLGAFFLALACASTREAARPLNVQVDEAAQAFFTDLARQGTAAQAYFTLFLPADTVNVRHLNLFRTEVEKALRKASTRASMHYNASADRVFFMSRYKPEGWQTPAGGDLAGEVLSRELSNGTGAGWTSLHAFWSQFNRLLIGDDAWIQNLPESIRADLSHPLSYVVRAGVSLDASPAVTVFCHTLTLELVEVGKERTVFSKGFPLVLSYPLP